MTVKELINELLDCRMDATVNVLVEIDKETIQDIMDRDGSYSYPIDDEIDVKTVDDLNTRVRIVLQEFKRKEQTMKIVVEVSEKDYLDFCLQLDNGILEETVPSHRAKIAIANGTPLPKGHGRLIDADKLIKDNGLTKATKYGNETREEVLFSYGTMMMYEIFDLIDDAEVVVEADKEGAEE